MRLLFLEWAFNSQNNNVYIVIELILILVWINKNLESRKGMEGVIGDALK